MDPRCRARARGRRMKVRAGLDDRGRARASVREETEPARAHKGHASPPPTRQHRLVELRSRDEALRRFHRPEQLPVNAGWNLVLFTKRSSSIRCRVRGARSRCQGITIGSQFVNERNLVNEVIAIHGLERRVEVVREAVVVLALLVAPALVVDGEELRLQEDACPAIAHVPGDGVRDREVDPRLVPEPWSERRGSGRAARGPGGVPVNAAEPAGPSRNREGGASFSRHPARRRHGLTAPRSRSGAPARRRSSRDSARRTPPRAPAPRRRDRGASARGSR